MRSTPPATGAQLARSSMRRRSACSPCPHCPSCFAECAVLDMRLRHSLPPQRRFVPSRWHSATVGPTGRSRCASAPRRSRGRRARSEGPGRRRLPQGCLLVAAATVSYAIAGRPVAAATVPAPVSHGLLLAASVGAASTIWMLVRPSRQPLRNVGRHGGHRRRLIAARVVVGAAAAGAAASLAFGSGVSATGTIPHPGNGGFSHGRLHLWSAALEVAERRPLSGFGADSFLTATFAAQDRFQPPVLYAHDLPVELAVEARRARATPRARPVWHKRLGGLVPTRWSASVATWSPRSRLGRIELAGLDVAPGRGRGGLGARVRRSSGRFASPAQCHGLTRRIGVPSCQAPPLPVPQDVQHATEMEFLELSGSLTDQL